MSGNLVQSTEKHNSHREISSNVGNIRWCRLAAGISAFALLSTCSTYTTLRASDGPPAVPRRTVSLTNTLVKQDETKGHYGVPYFLPKALIHLTISPIEPKKEEKKDAIEPKKDDTAAKATSPITLNVYVNGTKVTTDGSNNPPKTTDPVDPVTGTQSIDPKTSTSNSAGDASKANPNVAGLTGNGPSNAPQSSGIATEHSKGDEIVSVTSQYAIKIETLIVPDVRSGMLYAHYSPNWFFSEDVKVGVNAKQLLVTEDATSSDRTAQVIFNLADTAINIYKLANGAFSAARMGPASKGKSKTAGRQVLYRKMKIDVTFDPLDPEQVRQVQRLFDDDDQPTYSRVYVSPFRLSLHTATSLGIGLESKFPEVRRGLYFREPAVLEIGIVGREGEYRKYVERELGKSTAALKQTPKTLPPTGAQPPPQGAESKKTPEEEMHDDLLTQLVNLRTYAGEHTERVATIVPNKDRVYAYNVARSAFVQNKKTTLTIADGQLMEAHIVKPSEAEGFSEIPLKLSEKLLALPKDLLTYRKELITADNDLSSAKLTGFNNDEALRNATATRRYTEQAALVNSQTTSLKAKAAQIDAETSILTSGATLDQTEEGAAIQAEISRLKAEAARLDAETAVLKARAARELVLHPPKK